MARFCLAVVLSFVMTCEAVVAQEEGSTAPKGPQWYRTDGELTELPSSANQWMNCPPLSLDKLEGKGLARRRRGAPDRRVVAVAITPAGRRLLKRIEKPLTDWLDSRLGQLGEPGLRRLSRLLERLRQGPARPPG